MERLGRFSDLNIGGSPIRLVHHVKGHFENTEIRFLVLVKALERKKNEEIKRHSCHVSEATGSFARAKARLVLYAWWCGGRLPAGRASAQKGTPSHASYKKVVTVRQ